MGVFVLNPLATGDMKDIPLALHILLICFIFSFSSMFLGGKV